VSLALYGIGAGGLIALFFQDRLVVNFRQVLVRATLLQSAWIVLSLFIISNFDLKLGFSVAGIWNLCILYFACSAPFTIVGLVLALTMRVHPEKTAKIYFSDLSGSAIGCLAFLLAITYVSGPAVVIIAALLALAASVGFSANDLKSLSIARISVMAAVAVGLLFLNIGSDTFSIKHTKSYAERDDILFEKWSPLSRITVYPNVFWRRNPSLPFVWGISGKFQPQKPIEQLWIEQDASAGTPITRFDGDLSELKFLKYDITSLPYHLKPKSKAFIIGCGGGRDVLTALAFECPDILACDIHPVIIDLVREKYKDFAGNLYGLPQVRIEVAEARNYIRRSEERFDIIQIPLIDSWAATTSGAFSLAENSLYTVEAFADYFMHLNENGVLAITRFLFTPRNQSLRVAIVAHKALETLGEENPEQNIMVIGTSSVDGMATVLAKPKPFTNEEIDTVLDVAARLDFQALYVPGRAGDIVFTEALRTRPMKKFIEESYYDMRPTTDDKPFFFQMVYFSKAFDLILGKQMVGQSFNYYAQAVLLSLILISSILIAVFYLAPLIVSSKAVSMSKSWALYFILLGIGFMFVEIPMLQKGSLYLGHPTYSLSVVLFSMLVFSGFGSYCSGKISAPNLFRILPYCLLIAALFVGLTILCMEWVVPNTIGLSGYIRIGIMALFCGLMAFFMGMAFPSGVRLLARSSEASIPWAWALNGGASVLGSISAIAISMSLGYRLTLILGCATYVCSSLIIFYLARSEH